MKNHFLILSVVTCVLLCGSFSAHAKPDPSEGIEIIVEGVRYESLHAYRLKQIKRVLTEVLSSENLQEFNEEELSDIIKEVYRQQTAGALPNESTESGKPLTEKSQEGFQTPKDEVLDLSAAQMKEMLKEYQEEHNNSPSFDLDPEKVKNIIIEPKR